MYSCVTYQDTNHYGLLFLVKETFFLAADDTDVDVFAIAFCSIKVVNRGIMSYSFRLTNKMP